MAKSKLKSIETLVSQALIDMEISHEEFITILKEKDKYEKMKENLRSENENQEIMRLSRNWGLKKMSKWLIIYATNDFNWLKQKKVNNKKIILCVFMYKMVVEITK